MNSQEIRKRFLDYFAKRGHAVIPSASLIPEDKTVLFTTAGMQPLVPYLMGTPHPAGKRIADVQKCLRTDDIAEVGDNRHLTFFEMLGNWSLGDYFKKESIEWSFELLTSKTEGFGIPAEKLSVTVFEGDASLGLKLDEESVGHWMRVFKTAGIDASLGNRIYAYQKKKNWWELAGPGPCGPDTEIFYDTGAEHDKAFGEKCHVNCDCGKHVEIWNNVFMEYEKTIDSAGSVKYSPLAQKNVDTGMGFERLVMLLQGKNNVFETDLFSEFIELLPKTGLADRSKKIISDHMRAIVFLISDGVRPSNKGAGYVLRRLMRRVIVHEYLHSLGNYKVAQQSNIKPLNMEQLLNWIVNKYKDFYKELDLPAITAIFGEENNKFKKTLDAGIKELYALNSINAQAAFKLYESFGLPYEVIKEIGRERASALIYEDFDAEFKRHQEISRAGAEKKFGGHGLILNTGELKAANEEELKKVTRLHTATHMLQAALRKVLGEEVKQMGSDITAERTRFDFTFPRKLTPEEIKAVEDLVNGAVQKALSMQMKRMKIDEAKKTGALYFFKDKYPEEVNVYFLGNTIEDAFSKEFCGGPHVKNSSEVGTFKIVKEEAVAAGVRRIRADVL
ncbi:MAG: hypothetical protein A3B23_03160 [Candidatus Colwellbacteria bacterium RIFCSPLOWO2_01_FULL_48_10]|uniref:alanine--tRNA ligase n=1 Tax=Candidatus Colwellbacteria bacterium RIFCSPLOWO2_01_FULL_48_10 TaxID=1797690 RepID=A0A1G1Z620_9BACT|nr:MAG: hypothetical protein A3B23_03160 [Candidatus Colwellbacteria bacterium RIFCSPLOWO2_01_FULL_48_10]